MTKKTLIALADAIKHHNKTWTDEKFTAGQIRTLVDFCGEQNPRFNRERWLGYLADTCGPNGGKIPAKTTNKWIDSKLAKEAR